MCQVYQIENDCPIDNTSILRLAHTGLESKPSIISGSKAAGLLAFVDLSTFTQMAPPVCPSCINNNNYNNDGKNSSISNNSVAL